jgi:hypothetical protein
MQRSFWGRSLVSLGLAAAAACGSPDREYGPTTEDDGHGGGSECGDECCEGFFRAKPGDECEPFRDCEPGTYVSFPGSATEDRECSPCEEDTKSSEVNAEECLPIEPCEPGFFQAEPPGPTTNGCEPCERGFYCAGGDEEPEACPKGHWDGGDTSKPCIAHTECEVGTFPTNTPDAKTDRECREYTVCGDDQIEVEEPTETSDRVCEACLPGTESTGPNASECSDKAPVYREITAGYGHACGVREEDDEVQCWGAGTALNGPPAAVKFTTISAGDSNTCGIRVADKKLQCWGTKTDAQSPPSTTFVKVSCGDTFCCGIRESDEEVECWGTDITQEPTPDVKYTAVTAGAGFACALRKDTKRAVCWGNSGLGKTHPPSTPFASIALGATFGCGLRSDGVVEGWGGAVGEGTPLPGTFAFYDCGPGHCCGLAADGTPSCTDGGGGGMDPLTPPSGVKFKTVSVGQRFACGIRLDDGKAECWGPKNDYGQQDPPQTWFD